MKKGKLVSCIIICFLVVIFAIPGIAIGVDIAWSQTLHDDCSLVVNNISYAKPVEVKGIDVVTQDISCGYATIEMVGQWADKEASEEMLYRQNNNSISTLDGITFESEMNKQFTSYSTTIRRYAMDSDLLEMSYLQLRDNIPVPFEWACKDNSGNWILHFSLMVGMDFVNDNVKVLNPFGYIENITTHELLMRTSYKAYENMDFFTRCGFAFGIFERNTIFLIKRK